MYIVGFTCRRKTVAYAERHKEHQGIKLVVVKQTFIIKELTLAFFFSFLSKNQMRKKEMKLCYIIVDVSRKDCFFTGQLIQPQPGATQKINSTSTSKEAISASIKQKWLMIRNALCSTVFFLGI